MKESWISDRFTLKLPGLTVDRHTSNPNEHIHSYLEQPLHLAELASIAGVSQYHFCHLFKHSLGIAPYQYVLQQRMKKAKELLHQGKSTIAEPIGVDAVLLANGHMNNPKLWAKAGHQVVFSYSRDEAKLYELAASAGAAAKAGTVQDAASQDVILLAVWLPALEEVIRTAGSFDGKIVITCISGLQPDFSGQTIGIATDLKISIAETIQALLPNAKVVETFNTTFAEIIASNSRQFGSDFPSVFYCGNDVEAKQIVATLVKECGYEAVDAGNLLVARTLETLATAWVQFAVSSQLFPNLGLKALRR